MENMRSGGSGGLIKFSVFSEVRERFCKNFLDLIIALILLLNEAVTGYKILTLIYEDFGVLLAPSVLYPTLHLMEERGLVRRRKITERSGVYYLTEEGRLWVKERMIALTRLFMELERKTNL
jgi:DNA-binding PadR family transcriptional regulator